MNLSDDITHAMGMRDMWNRRVEYLRSQQPRRTPSTGLPPVCDGAAAMRIDPPGAVASPHAVVRDIPQDRPIPSIRLARMVMSVAETVTLNEDMSLADALKLLAERIAHPLRLGEHG